MNKRISIVLAAAFVVNLLAVAAPAQDTQVPDIRGIKLTDAELLLTIYSLSLGSRTYICHDTVPAGLIISQSPKAWSVVPVGTPVDLEISTGPCVIIEVPDVVGMSDEEARSVIRAASFSDTATYMYSDTIPEGIVFGQNPAAGTLLQKGLSVDLIISMGPQHSPPVQPDASCLAAHWKLDDGSGTTAVDSSGNGFDMMMYDNTWEDGVLEGAAHFHGVGYGEVSDVNYSDNVITLCAWVWHDEFIINKIERYVTAGQSTAAICKEYDGRLVFYVDTDDNLRHLLAKDVLTQGQWHHVAGTWDGLTQRLYIDGVEIASQVPVTTGVLGGISNVTLSSETRPFNGMLDDVCIYNCALSINEIRYLAGF